jgi:hypothetical protein
MTLLGMGPALSGVDVEVEHVRVRMGWAFRATVPRTAIRSVAQASGFRLAWGVHGWRGDWLVNGSLAGRVRLELDPAQRARVVGVPVRLRSLEVSVEQPDGLVAALGF